jgi:hypothetical protein
MLYPWSKGTFYIAEKLGFLLTFGIPHGYLMHLPGSRRLFGKTRDKRGEVTGRDACRTQCGFAIISPVQKKDSKNSSVDIIYNSKL